MKCWSELANEYREYVSEVNPDWLENDEVAVRCGWCDFVNAARENGDINSLQDYYVPAFEDVGMFNTIEDDADDILTALGIVLHECEYIGDSKFKVELLRKSNNAIFGHTIHWDKDGEAPISDIVRDIMNGGDFGIVENGGFTNEEWYDLAEILA